MGVYTYYIDAINEDGEKVKLKIVIDWQYVYIDEISEEEMKKEIEENNNG